MFKVEPIGTTNSNSLLEDSTDKPFIIKTLEGGLKELAHPLHKTNQNLKVFETKKRIGETS